MSLPRNRFSQMLRPVVRPSAQKVAVGNTGVSEVAQSMHIEATDFARWWLPKQNATAQEWSDEVLQVFMRMASECPSWQADSTWLCAMRDAVWYGDFWMADLLMPAGLFRLVLSGTDFSSRLSEMVGLTDGLQAPSPCHGLGSRITLSIPTLPGTVHLQSLPGLGCFFLQPLVLNLQRYANADAVFAARDSVLTYRRAKLQSAQASTQCSRRGFFARLVGKSDSVGAGEVG